MKLVEISLVFIHDHKFRPFIRPVLMEPCVRTHAILLIFIYQL